VRNQFHKTAQVSPPARTWRIWAGWRCVPARVGGELLGRLHVVGREATSKVCGVDVARPQRHSWAPNLSTGQIVNVGTVWWRPPSIRPGWRWAGTSSADDIGRDGAGVVVGAQESCVHGEDRQHDRSGGTVMPGGRL